MNAACIGLLVCALTWTDRAFSTEWPTALREVFPRGVRLAILYHPSRRTTVDALLRDLPTNFSAFPIEVPSAPIGRYFYRLSDAQAVIVLVDDDVITSKMAPAIIMSTYRRNLPVITDSAEWTSAGAIFSIDEKHQLTINEAVLKAFALPQPQPEKMP